MLFIVSTVAINRKAIGIISTPKLHILIFNAGCSTPIIQVQILLQFYYIKLLQKNENK